MTDDEYEQLVVRCNLLKRHLDNLTYFVQRSDISGAQNYGRAMAATISAMSVEKILEEQPDIEAMAFALFATDEQVEAFILGAGEGFNFSWPLDEMLQMNPLGPRTETWPERRQRVLVIAWQRNEHGWATEARERAREVLCHLRGRA